MKVVERSETVQRIITVFAAEDGTEFDNFEECAVYEDSCRRAKLRKRVEHCSGASGRANCIGKQQDPFGENEYEWFRPKSKEDIDLLNSVLDGGKGRLSLSHVGQWVCFESIPHNGFRRLSSLDEGIAYVKSLFGALGYDIAITEKSKDGEPEG